MNNRLFYLLFTFALAASILFWLNMFRKGNPAPSVPPGQATAVTMYHAEGCECCVRWADYLEKHGFRVVKVKVPDLQVVKNEKGVPNELSSCHTAVIGNYVVEGHVPAEDIRRLLTDQPEAIGLSVPGMPASSPGMDMPSNRPWYTVLFDDEKSLVYNTHR